MAHLETQSYFQGKPSALIGKEEIMEVLTYEGRQYSKVQRKLSLSSCILSKHLKRLYHTNVLSCYNCCCYCHPCSRCPFLLLVSLPSPAPSPLTPGPMVLLQKKRERRMERTALREWDLAGPLNSATPTKPSLCPRTPAFLFSPTQTGMCAAVWVFVYECLPVFSSQEFY